MSASSADAPIRVRVDYDFASSLCYVAHRCMQRLEHPIADLGIDLCWSPVDLTRITGWRRGAEVDDDRRQNVARVCAELQVSLEMPRVWLDSRHAHAVGLSLDGTREPTWREAVFSLIFEAGRWPTQENLHTLARQLDLELDPEAIARSADELVARTESAREQEVTGVPNFMLGRWPFGGIQNDDTMLSIFGRFAAKQRDATHGSVA